MRWRSRLFFYRLQHVGDVTAPEIEDEHLLMYKVTPRQDHYVQALSGVVREWNSPEDEDHLIGEIQSNRVARAPVTSRRSSTTASGPQAASSSTGC